MQQTNFTHEKFDRNHLVQLKSQITFQIIQKIHVTLPRERTSFPKFTHVAF